MPCQPIDSKRLYEQVADQIADMIRRGEFQAGQRLPAERDLAKSVGVSRPVVREAMVALPWSTIDTCVSSSPLSVSRTAPHWFVSHEDLAEAAEHMKARKL